MFHNCQLSGIQMEIIQVKAPIHSRCPREAGFGMVTACGCQEGHIQHWHRGSTQEGNTTAPDKISSNKPGRRLVKNAAHRVEETTSLCHTALRPSLRKKRTNGPDLWGQGPHLH